MGKIFNQHLQDAKRKYGNKRFPWSLEMFKQFVEEERNRRADSAFITLADSLIEKWENGGGTKWQSVPWSTELVNAYLDAIGRDSLEGVRILNKLGGQLKKNPKAVGLFSWPGKLAQALSDQSIPLFEYDGVRSLVGFSQRVLTTGADCVLDDVTYVEAGDSALLTLGNIDNYVDQGKDVNGDITGTEITMDTTYTVAGSDNYAIGGKISITKNATAAIPAQQIDFTTGYVYMLVSGVMVTVDGGSIAIGVNASGIDGGSGDQNGIAFKLAYTDAATNSLSIKVGEGSNRIDFPINPANAATRFQRDFLLEIPMANNAINPEIHFIGKINGVDVDTPITRKTLVGNDSVDWNAAFSGMVTETAGVVLGTSSSVKFNEFVLFHSPLRLDREQLYEQMAIDFYNGNSD